jgi:hypothetical protein
MAGEPNELPEGGEGGGGFEVPRGEFPAELPVSQRVSQVALLQEVIRVRTRLHQIENAALVRSVLGGAATTVPDPAELPEGGEGGGGFGGGIVGEFPGEQPFELPVGNDRLITLESQVAQLTKVITQLSEQVKQIQR